MRETISTQPIIDLVQSFSDLLQQGSQIGLDFLESLGQVQVPDSMSTIMQQLGLPKMRSTKTCCCQQSQGGCSCKIPPPCWAPRCLGEVVSHVCPGGTASIRICITNSGTTRREFTVDVGENAKGVTLTPSALSLGPMEHGSIVASAALPADASSSHEHEVRLWIHGCRDYILCWTVKVAKRGASCGCHEIEVCDGPDWIHHWYDHFYCERPCA